MRVLLSILTRPDLVGDLQGQVGSWLLFYYSLVKILLFSHAYYFFFLQRELLFAFANNQDHLNVVVVQSLSSV